MKIVVLDGYGLNPGDLSWEEMRALGELTVYDRTAPAELLERSAGAEVLITNKTVITAEDMAALPALKYWLRDIILWTSRLRKRGASLSPTYLPTAPLPLPRWSLRIY